ncbi:hypothetical protein KV097_17930 [Mumia sp. zg.B17]|uniref:hypothetical protein n=1 Tax=Mumia sp. zg.B17 TaxID=2855446 RepID=UPI001C6E49AE|nr:hypothetical protein [Mumia sp. zg.B17]MBW9207820.1 hypothetical protein [Mumia sp. zg.B17]
MPTRRKSTRTPFGQVSPFSPAIANSPDCAQPTPATTGNADATRDREDGGDEVRPVGGDHEIAHRGDREHQRREPVVRVRHLVAGCGERATQTARPHEEPARQGDAAEHADRDHGVPSCLSSRLVDQLVGEGERAAEHERRTSDHPLPKVERALDLRPTPGAFWMAMIER